MSENAVVESARRARDASLVLAGLSAETRNRALLAMADAVAARRDEILAENKKDIDAARELIAQGKIAKSDAKRLELAGSKFDAVVEGLRSVASLPDPIGQTLRATELDAGLNLYRVACPIGVIAVIFESRPDALPQIASLCLKSGNAVLLKGGSEAIRSNRALARVLDEAARSVQGVPAGWMTLLETREDIAEILKLDDLIDLVIPRGSNAFVRYIMDNTNIPVTGHRDGICHTYVHAAADPDKAIRIAVDAKTQYPSVCNATETLLVDAGAVETIWPAIAVEMRKKGVELRVDKRAKEALLGSGAGVPPVKKHGQDAHATGRHEQDAHATLVDATEQDWRTEHLDLVLGVRVVDDVAEAIDHVNRYGSHHTDSIVTEDPATAERFLREVDSASVIHNASTRFADGFRYGLGAEVGISTSKIHSRGPVGLEGLTIYKYILRGSGQIVADYTGPSAHKFTHRGIS
ncbi:glutamate-5-semialdehyde dehydrogenase [Candidatus Sumerlaeota bacterium]|nr:glutamate-5-semialdehyde dehydrogenase [Candidatus Sumerlaeota bacterium]